MEDVKLCDYGCKKVAKFQLKNSKWCCCKSYNSCENIRRKNSESLIKTYQENKRELRGFSDLSRIKSLESRKQNLLNLFLKNPNRLYSSESLKSYLIQLGRNYRCESCGISEWNNKEITLEIDHIDGNRINNYPDNLRFLCPNCHSQTESWRGRKSNTGKVIVSDDEFLKVLKSSKNIRQALITLGLAPKGGNYERALRLLKIASN